MGEIPSHDLAREGILFCFPDASYRRIDRLSKHALDDFWKNPYAFVARKVAGTKPVSDDSPALAAGRAVHAATLTPDAFASQYAIQPEHIKVRRGKEWELFSASAAAQDREVIRKDDFDFASRVAEAVAASSNGKSLLKTVPLREVSLLWTETTESYEAVRMKARVDFMSKNGVIVGDLKTTSDASPEAFARDADAFGYDIQAAVYLRALRANGFSPSVFVFLVVEKEFPFVVSSYSFDSDSEFIRAGELAFVTRIEEYARIMRDPAGYASRAQGWTSHNLDLPSWSKRLAALRGRDAELASSAIQKLI